MGCAKQDRILKGPPPYNDPTIIPQGRKLKPTRNLSSWLVCAGCKRLNTEDLTTRQSKQESNERSTYTPCHVLQQHDCGREKKIFFLNVKEAFTKLGNQNNCLFGAYVCFSMVPWNVSFKISNEERIQKIQIRHWGKNPSKLKIHGARNIF